MIRIAALYRFAPIADPSAKRAAMQALLAGEGIRGTLLIAVEGVNGTIAGQPDALGRALDGLRAITGLDGLELKFSEATDMPFRRLKVRLKAEIVTMGVPTIDPLLSAGTYVEPADWNALIADPETLVIDTRNAYETALGTFAGAVDPATDTFGDFPAWVEANRDMLTGRRIAMFCTGGIRCEKATAYVRQAGFNDVHHLKGGILRYLEDVPADQSLWQGDCFVFDERVAVGHGLAVSDAALCRACRHPISNEDRSHPHFSEGVSCPRCHGTRSAEDLARFAERQRQMDLAEQRGVSHLGPR